MYKSHVKYHYLMYAGRRIFFFMLILIVFDSLPLLGQMVVQGVVIEKDGRRPVPGTSVTLKGTGISTTTTADGSFSIQVNKEGDILVVKSIAHYTREIVVRGQGPFTIKLRNYCNIDYFDNRLISLGFQSGLLHTPLGGSIRISLPYMHLPGTFWAGAQYQKGSDAYMTRLDAGYDHMISDCNFRLDMKAGHAKVSYNNEVNALITTVGGTAHFHRLFPGVRYFNVSAGAGHLSFYDRNLSRWRPYLGPFFGLGTALFRKNKLYVSTQVLVARHHPEFQLRLNKSIRKFSFFSNYYQLNGFKEITVGAGWSFYYRTKSKGHN